MTGFVIEEQGDWFEAEMPVMRRLIRPGWTCVDVGACYGVYALPMCRLVGTSGSVIAIEPQHDLCNALRHSKSADSAESTAKLRIEELAVTGDPDVQLSLTSPADPELAALSSEGDCDVELARLDDVVSGDVDYLKIDAEGQEDQVLGGAERVISNPNVIIQVAIRGGGRLQVKLCDRLQRRGFLLHRSLSSLGTIVPLRIGDQLDGFDINIMAIRNEKARALREEGLIAGCVTEEDWQSTGIKVQDILDRVLHTSQLKGMGLNWQPNPIHPGWEQQRRAVALASESLSGNHSPDQRVAGLLAAYRGCKAALAQTTTGSRLFTLARIAWSLGWRSEATQTLEKATQVTEKATKEAVCKAFSEPCVMPLPAFDGILYPDLPTLARGVAFESLLMTSGFSAFFGMSRAAVLAEKLKSLPVRSPRAERTLAMLDRREASMPAVKL